MNLRTHSDQCENGKPCRRCYLRVWDKKRRDENRKNAYTPRKRDTSPRSEGWIKEQRLKGRANHTKRYSEKRSEVLAKNAEWRKENSHKLRGYAAKYRAAKLRATPPWADLKKIQEIYDNCPPGMEVDHDVPLQGETVCGLHVHYNLQYLSVSENRSKRNRLKVG